MEKRAESISKFDFQGMRIPVYMIASLAEYIEHGIGQGDFLMSLLEGNLVKMCLLADDCNMWRLPVYAAYLYNHAPIGCYGSVENAKDWMERGGLVGMVADRKKEV